MRTGIKIRNEKNDSINGCLVLVLLSLSIIVIAFLSCCVQVTKENEVKRVRVTLVIKFSEDAENVTAWVEDKSGRLYPNNASEDHEDNYNYFQGEKGKVWIFCNITIENATVYGVLSESAKRGNFSVESYYDGKYGSHFVTSIGGVKGDDKKAWQYWQNRKYGQVGASLADVNNGDLIEWRYVSFG
ncbi:MAG: DUF4430 domain-containing protein [Thermoplasmata archaeon]